MKKLLIILTLLLTPVMSFAGSSMADSVKEFGETVKQESGKGMGNVMGQSDGTLGQVWEQFKNDPMGQTKYYWDKLVTMMVEGYNAAKEKITAMLN